MVSCTWDILPGAIFSPLGIYLSIYLLIPPSLPILISRLWYRGCLVSCFSSLVVGLVVWEARCGVPLDPWAGRLAGGGRE